MNVIWYNTMYVNATLLYLFIYLLYFFETCLEGNSFRLARRVNIVLCFLLAEMIDNAHNMQLTLGVKHAKKQRLP